MLDKNIKNTPEGIPGWSFSSSEKKVRIRQLFNLVSLTLVHSATCFEITNNLSYVFVKDLLAADIWL
jgi:hypothetical protein